MKLYNPEAVSNYLHNLPEEKGVFEVVGNLIDNYFVFHEHAVEVFLEKATTTWNSAYTRHIYKKRIPKKIFDCIAEAVAYFHEVKDFDRKEDTLLLEELLIDFNETKKGAA